MFFVSKISFSFLRLGNVAAFLITLVINGLAGTAILNNRTTVQVSDLYSNPFTPAGYVFAIWGIIYALLAVFIIFQALPIQKEGLFQKQIGVLFILSCVFNCVWLFLWQYDYITFSVVAMFGLFLSLLAIYWRLSIGKSNASRTEKICVHLPFSVYIGWITVASIANVAAALVSVGWDGFGLGVEAWAIIAIGVALISTLIVIIARRDYAFSLVVIWALVGIAVRQISNPTIVLIVEEAVALILVVAGLSLVASILKRRALRS